jgi:hypothetical protein
VYEWIAASWAMNQQGKDGALVFCDNTFEATNKLEFFDALITETTIPSCDAASKEAAFLRLKVTPWVLGLSEMRPHPPRLPTECLES